MDFLKIIIEGGWVVQDTLEWISILDFLNVDADLDNNPQAKEFFIMVSKIFDFEEDFQQNFLMFEDDWFKKLS